jgi:hypothetical protein
MVHVIFVTEQDADHEVELCRVEGDPVPIVTALRAKRLRVHLGGSNKPSSIPKYCSVRVEKR